MLQPSEAVRHAHALYRAFGDRAEAEAARRAVTEKTAGHRDAARDWDRIRAVIRQVRGPRET